MGTHIREFEDANGQLVEISYFCSRGCWQDSFAPERMGLAEHGTQPDDAGAYPCAESEVDAPVHCAECGVRMSGEDAPVVVNLIDRPPIGPFGEALPRYGDRLADEQARGRTNR